MLCNNERIFFYSNKSVRFLRFPANLPAIYQNKSKENNNKQIIFFAILSYSRINNNIRSDRMLKIRCDDQPFHHLRRECQYLNHINLINQYLKTF